MTQMGSSRQKTYKTFFAILSIFILIYGMFKIFPLLRGPQIFVEGLKNGENHGPIAFISGKTVGAKELKLNNNEIILDEEGNFSDTLLLSAGYNIISLSAKDGFGRERTKTYNITASDFNFQDPTPTEEEIVDEEKIKEEETAEVAGENITETDTELTTEVGVAENQKLLN
jgi:hypothetical protein